MKLILSTKDKIRIQAYYNDYRNLPATSAGLVKLLLELSLFYMSANGVGIFMNPMIGCNATHSYLECEFRKYEHMLSTKHKSTLN